MNISPKTTPEKLRIHIRQIMLCHCLPEVTSQVAETNKDIFRPQRRLRKPKMRAFSGKVSDNAQPKRINKIAFDTPFCPTISIEFESI